MNISIFINKCEICPVEQRRLSNAECFTVLKRQLAFGLRALLWATVWWNNSCSIKRLKHSGWIRHIWVSQTHIAVQCHKSDVWRLTHTRRHTHTHSRVLKLCEQTERVATGVHNKHLKTLNMCTDEVLNFPDTRGTLRVPLVENWKKLKLILFFFLSLLVFLLQSLRQHLRFVNTKSKKKRRREWQRKCFTTGRGSSIQDVSRQTPKEKKNVFRMKLHKRQNASSHICKGPLSFALISSPPPPPLSSPPSTQLLGALWSPEVDETVCGLWDGGEGPDRRVADHHRRHASYSVLLLLLYRHAVVVVPQVNDITETRAQKTLEF